MEHEPGLFLPWRGLCPGSLVKSFYFPEEHNEGIVMSEESSDIGYRTPNHVKTTALIVWWLFMGGLVLGSYVLCDTGRTVPVVTSSHPKG